MEATNSGVVLISQSTCNTLRCSRVRKKRKKRKKSHQNKYWAGWNCFKSLIMLLAEEK
jgi:hypothetical protein